MHVCVIVGEDVPADRTLLADIVTGECAALGVPGRLVETDSPGHAPEQGASDQASDQANGESDCVVGDLDCARVVVAGTSTSPSTSRSVWCDLGAGPIADGVDGIYGRGLWGLAWAIRRAVHRRRRPAQRIAYGRHPEQWGELRTPASATPGGWPVAMLVHGGYWRSMWTADLMDALAIDLADRGFAAWNVEYRRPDRHGWDATVADVAAALAAIADLPGLTANGVTVIGHSAGAQLGLRLAADAGPTRIAQVVSLAGVADLTQGERRGLSNGAVASALGGSSWQQPDRYAAADPMARIPIGVPLLVVYGRGDDLDLIDISRGFATAATDAGDDVRTLTMPGDHFAVIDPASDIWRATADQLLAQPPEH